MDKFLGWLAVPRWTYFDGVVLATTASAISHGSWVLAAVALLGGMAFSVWLEKHHG